MNLFHGTPVRRKEGSKKWFTRKHAPPGSPPMLRSATSPAKNEAGPSNQTDRTTATLAQKLNELAASNAEGLLGDAEYRLLRQNLFERFNAREPPPAEAPPVRLSSITPVAPSPDSSFPTSKSTSTPSVRSNQSRSSNMTSAIRSVFRSRRASTQPASPASTAFPSFPNDAASILSGDSSMVDSSYRPSTSSHPFGLESHPSSGSLRSHSQSDARSINSGKTGRSGWTSRTGASRGPPSSYHQPRRMASSIDTDGEESSAELRAQIAAMEEEKRTLLESFGGLEVTAHSSSSTSNGGRGARSGQLWTPEPHHSRKPVSTNLSAGMKQWPTLADRKASLGLSGSQSNPNLAGSDQASSSQLRSTSSHNYLPSPPLSAVPSSPASSRRQPSYSDAFASSVPPVPPLPTHTRAYPGSHSPSSSSSLPSPALRTTLAPVFDGRDDAMLQRIRQGRAQTEERYDERLQLLRAKLKSAELRERLLVR